MLEWINDKRLRVGDAQFVVSPIGGAPSTKDRMMLCKTRDLVELHASLLQSLQPRKVFELGIHQGGSTALTVQLIPVEKLVAIELGDEVPALDRYLALRGMRRRVKTYYGVDQSDTARLREILDAEFGTELLDLVVDDASHREDATRTSFNVLFPRLRPGGVYVIEDWNWSHHPWPTVVSGAPLSVLMVELLLATGHPDRVIARMDVQDSFATIVRGDVELDLATFEIARWHDDWSRTVMAGIRYDTSQRGT